MLFGKMCLFIEIIFKVPICLIICFGFVVAIWVNKCIIKSASAKMLTSIDLNTKHHFSCDILASFYSFPPRRKELPTKILRGIFLLIEDNFW
jgi:hypothetical protein